MRFIFFLIYFFLLSSSIAVFSQQKNEAYLKKKYFIPDQCSIRVDNHTLIPSSIVITADKDTITDFTIQNNKILFSETICQKYGKETLEITYRTFGFDVEHPYFIVDSSVLTFKEKALITGFEYRPDAAGNNLIDSRTLDYKGSFSRGISIGNSQSLVVNSNFDMQMVGDLGNGIRVVAAISDENLPIQAQGNTQQLQEFDKVFIQISKAKTALTAGDYELRRPNSYFMNYFKKLKGITLASTFTTGKDTEIFTKGSFAISRGKFARQNLKTNEGNQGPYRLQGNNSERFIIVLAGTEKIYFNGKLLTRGYDYDYVIDYNRAEITFSPTRIIARDSRVIVEFEYTDITYLRSLYAGQTEYKGKRWNANFNFYSEQDSKSSTGDLQLDSTDFRILAENGDNLSKAVRKSYRTVTDEEKISTQRILYKGIPDPDQPDSIILIFTENVDSARYTAVFTEFGQGKGDYNIDNTKNKNARVYKYAGKNMGSYQPVIQLIPPEQKQLFTVNGAYKFSTESDVFGEIGLSNLDHNRLSAIDDSDNTGLSSLVSINHAIRLDTAARYLVKANIKHEYVGKNFNALNPFRAPEFVRDWNTTQLTGKGDENLLMGNLSLISKAGFNADYGYNSYSKGDIYRGEKHTASLKYDKRRIFFTAYSTFLTSASLPVDQKTVFVRPNILLQIKLDQKARWTTGVELDAESNNVRSMVTDKLLRQSYEFRHYKWFLNNDVNSDFSVKLALSNRNDFFEKDNILQQASNAKEIELAGKWLASAASDLSWSFIGRSLDVKDPSLLPNDISKKTILGRLDYSFSAWKQAVRSTTSYNANSGQEPKVEYVFQKVETGQGDYFLISQAINPNLSNIQDFRYDPSNPLSNYIRLTLVNNEFIRTNNIEINQNLSIEPARIFGIKDNQKIVSKLLSKFSTLSNLRITKKQLQTSEIPLSTYVDFTLRDTSLVAYNSLISNTLFFNKGNPKYDVQFGNRNNQNRVVQVSGKEDRGNDEYFVRLRWNIKNKADLFLAFEKSLKSYQSQAFGDRNLDIGTYRIKPEVSIRPSQNSRINFKYNFQKKKQRILTGDEASLNEFSSEYTLRRAGKYSFDINVRYVNIDFSGEANSYIEYDLLEGLKNGRNFIWSINYTRRVAKNIDLTFNYEGRKTGISPLVNVARAQMKATF